MSVNRSDLANRITLVADYGCQGDTEHGKFLATKPSQTQPHTLKCANHSHVHESVEQPGSEPASKPASAIGSGAGTTAAVNSSRTGTIGVLSLLARDIKLAHSVFALPFALLGACVAYVLSSDTSQRDPARLVGKLVLVVACMIFARSWAMLFNRLADRHIDALNERTKKRVLASGTVSRWAGWSVAFLCASAFVVVCALFKAFFDNPWPLYLSVPVLAWIAFYSLTKRFTALCHVFLGGALAASPLAAAIAIDPAALIHAPMVWWLAGFVLLWVAGFDIIYALQDEAFDRANGLKSVPVLLGWRRAIQASRVLHVGAMLCLLAAWSSLERLGPIFGVGVGLAGALLLVEQIVLARRGMRGLDMAFFTVNGVVSCVLGVLGILDVFL